MLESCKNVRKLQTHENLTKHKIAYLNTFLFFPKIYVYSSILWWRLHDHATFRRTDGENKWTMPTLYCFYSETDASISMLLVNHNFEFRKERSTLNSLVVKSTRNNCTLFMAATRGYK